MIGQNNNIKITIWIQSFKQSNNTSKSIAVSRYTRMSALRVQKCSCNCSVVFLLSGRCNERVAVYITKGIRIRMRKPVWSLISRINYGIAIVTPNSGPSSSCYGIIGCASRICTRYSSPGQPCPGPGWG